MRNSSKANCVRAESLFLHGLTNQTCHVGLGGVERTVPEVYHAIANSATAPWAVRVNSQQNPSLRLAYVDIHAAAGFIQQKCGAAAHQAYIKAEGQLARADLFAFCALYSVGGYYCDANLVLMSPIYSAISQCYEATAGYAYPRAILAGELEKPPAISTKLLSAHKGSNVFKCALGVLTDALGANDSGDPGAVSPRDTAHGNEALSLCFWHCRYLDCNPKGALTYIDTKYAAWPRSGLMGRDSKGYPALLAYEIPGPNEYYGEIMS